VLGEAAKKLPVKANVTKIKDLKTVLKDLERRVKAPDFLRTGREFKNFALRPRELLANLLICAAGNSVDSENRLTVCTDPSGGDGLILNEKHGGYMTTEHVFVPSKEGGAESVESRFLAAIKHKQKKGTAYCSGKDLVIFSEAQGVWKPTYVARKIAGRHDFQTVWVVHLEKSDNHGYSYCVSWLEARKGNAPSWRISVNAEFTDWQVERIQ
jgi:hypothetical protein